MILSILIPTYDYCCYKLVEDLHKQAESLGIDYEILLAEDGSKDRVSIIANHKISDLPHCKHIVREHNVGLAQLRNELAAMAQGEWLLFLDNDARVEKADFIATYLQHTAEAPIIIGGLYTPPVNYDPHRTLRHRYELQADKHRSAAERQQSPYDNFSCFNILMHRETFLDIRFCDTNHQYGYEDAIFGAELDKRGIAVLHIDNALLHTGIDTNESFLRKTEIALHTLRALQSQMQGHSRLLQLYQRIQSLHLTWALRLFHFVCAPLMRRNLLSRKPSLRIFALYKLSYYATTAH